MDRIPSLLNQVAGLPSWALPIALTGAAALLGWLCERPAYRLLRWAASRTPFLPPDAIVVAIRRMPVVWFGCAGLYWSIRMGGFPESWLGTTTTAVTLVLSVTLLIVAMRVSTAGVGTLAGRYSGLGEATTLVQNVVKLLLLLVGGAVILRQLGIDVTTLVAALGISGLAVALALQDTLGNLFAGLQIIMSRQVRPGDYVELATGEEGAVTDIQARNTTIRTFPERNRVLVPNAILASTVVTNYSLPHRRLLIRLPIGVSYDSDLEKVEAITVAVAREVLSEVDGGLTDEEPFVRYEEFADFSINFILRVPVRDFMDQFLVRHVLVKRIQERYREEGIEIPFPIRTLITRDPANTEEGSTVSGNP